MSRPVPMVGYVLIGGQSGRMGVAKAHLAVGGRPMAARAAAALAGAGVHPVTAVGGEESLGRQLGLGWVADRWPGEGPLGGVVTALEHARGADAVVVACDMPFLTPSDVAAVTVHAATDVVVAVAGGRRQPLLARYRPGALEPLARVFASGERSLSAAIGTVRTTEVAVGGPAIADVDTPGQLAEARARVADRRDDRHSGGIDDIEQVPEIDVDELARRRAEGAPLLDVRQPEEYAEVHVPGATLIPLDELPDRLGDVPKGGPLPVICATGVRSRVAGEFLISQGIDAVNVAGGTKAWIEGGFDVDSGAA